MKKITMNESVYVQNIYRFFPLEYNNNYEYEMEN